jgi:hypothetical protein
MKDNYKDIERKLVTLTPFTGNSMRGQWEGDTYRVYSYSTLIGFNRWTSFGIDDAKYSVTTSRHQNLLRKAWAE